MNGSVPAHSPSTRASDSARGAPARRGESVGARAAVPQRITLVIASLASGGAERVMVTMANHWAAAGRDVSLITLYAEEADFFRLDPRVRRTSLDVGFPTSGAVSAVFHNVRRVRRLREAIRALRPDVTVSFITEVNVLSLLALLGTGIPLVVSERTDPRHQMVGRAWRELRRALYRAADAIVVQSPEVRDWVAPFAGRARVHVVANPVADQPAGGAAEHCTTPARIQVAANTILAMGRLSREKGFDLLIRAFASIAGSYPDWSVAILGEGEERGNLEALIADLGMADRVRLPGRVSDAMAVLSRGTIFALPSRYEGFPNALLEAMASGLPVVAADCPSGPRQIVRNGIDGLLVAPDDVVALAAGLDQLMASEPTRRRLASAAPAVTTRFGVDRVMDEWDALLCDAVDRRERVAAPDRQ